MCVRLSPSGLPSDRPGLPLLSVAHWGGGGRRERESSEACLPLGSLTSIISTRQPYINAVMNNKITHLVCLIFDCNVFFMGVPMKP